MSEQNEPKIENKKEKIEGLILEMREAAMSLAKELEIVEADAKEKGVFNHHYLETTGNMIRTLSERREELVKVVGDGIGMDEI